MRSRNGRVVVLFRPQRRLKFHKFVVTFVVSQQPDEASHDTDQNAD
jgi:hypothetical protein